MTLWKLVWREITFRKAGFAVGLISVTVAMAGLVGAVTLLRAHDVSTDRILAERERETREEMLRMEDDYRRITRDLEWAQSALGMEGKINMILALECACDADKLGAITREVQGILPGVQVVEFSTRVAARARARDRAAEAHQTAIEAERRHRAVVAASHRRFSRILVPVVLAGAAVWIFFLVLNNVRERKAEIGILRAVGVREGTVMAIFLCKAVVIGLVGALAGYAIGLSVGAVWGGVSLRSAEFAKLANLALFFSTLAVAPLLCAAAGWIPALRAAQQDPAVVLREE